MSDKQTRRQFYSVDGLVDAPEHYAYSRALGVLTWSTWDHEVRPASERIRDFVSAYPPEEPTRFLNNSPTRGAVGLESLDSEHWRLDRFVSEDWRSGSLHELLARYGLKCSGSQLPKSRLFVPTPLRESAQRRNLKLRLLHGGVDVEPENMDVAKRQYVEKQEKIKAAQDVRDALKRMKEGLESS